MNGLVCLDQIAKGSLNTNPCLLVKEFFDFDRTSNRLSNFFPTATSKMSYFLVEKVEGIMLGTKSGNLYTDYTNLEKNELLKNHKYWMSARANDGDTPNYYSK